MQLLAAAEFGRMLFVVGEDLGVGRRGDVFGLLADQFLAPHLVAFLDDGGAGIVADGGRDLFGRNLYAVRGGIFGEDHFLEVLIDHGAGHFGSELRQVGAGVSVEIALEIAERDHALADAGDDVGRNRRFSMAGDGRENCGGEEGEAAHGAREV